MMYKQRIIFILAIVLAMVPMLCCVMMYRRMCVMENEIEYIGVQLEQLLQLTADEQTGSVSLGDADYMQAGSVSMGDAGDTGDADDYSMYSHRVYLTFDDGPSIYTDEILDILDSYGVKATFFVVGKDDDTSKAALKRIVDEGHTLGMHSYSHKYKDIYASVDSFAADVTKLQDYLYEVTGVKSRYYRFPGGSSNTISPVDMSEFAEYLHGQDIEFYDWNIYAGDAESKKPSEEKIVENSLEGISWWKTSIILMHDSADKHTTVEALPEIIESIQAMDDTVILPITDDTMPVQHIHMESDEN
jgi:peptidoglycan/xylan/chitin deacetylase (PgdA/CDA1 family)